MNAKSFARTFFLYTAFRPEHTSQAGPSLWVHEITFEMTCQSIESGCTQRLLRQLTLTVSLSCSLLAAGCSQSKTDPLARDSKTRLGPKEKSERPSRPRFTKKAQADDQSTPLVATRVGPAIAKFGRSLMDQARARSNADENLLVSPMTVYRSLTLARSGARGRTAIELNLALGLPADASARDVEFTVGRVTSSVIDDAQNTWTESSEGETIANANRAFVSDAFQVDESINERNLETLGDSFVNKNFREQAERSRQEINAWVNEQTRNRFKNLVPPGAMSSSTRLVLVDATWFKGDWEHAFDKRRTKRLPFLVNGTKSERVPTMRLASNFRVFDVEGQDYRAIELPYVRHRISMTLVVPKEGHDLKSLESRLDLSQVIELVAKRPRTKVDLRLPRFQVESSTSVSLLDTLRSMDLGLETAFGDARADFFALTPTLAPLAIDDVFHKSVLVVNEYGGIPATSLDKTKTQKQTSGNATRFYVDRPFLFFVHHKQSKTLLFAGRIMDPLRRH